MQFTKEMLAHVMCIFAALSSKRVLHQRLICSKSHSIITNNMHELIDYIYDCQNHAPFSTYSWSACLIRTVVINTTNSLTILSYIITQHADAHKPELHQSKNRVASQFFILQFKAITDFHFLLFIPSSKVHQIEYNALVSLFV